MAQEIVMPKLGNTVESVIIVEWKKDIGDSVAVGDALCEVETDKATVDVEAEVAGTLLAKLFEADDDVEVLVPFAIIGEAGEDVSGMIPGAGGGNSASPEAPAAVPAAETAPAAAPAMPAGSVAGTPAAAPAPPVPTAPTDGAAAPGLSPSNGMCGPPWRDGDP